MFKLNENYEVDQRIQKSGYFRFSSAEFQQQTHIIIKNISK